MMFASLTLSDIILLIVCLLISLVIHEFMHAYVGYKLGDTTAQEEGRLSLNPLQHIDPFMTLLLPVVTILLFSTPILAAKPVPFNPARVKYDEFGAAMIAAAGPLSNLALAAVAALLLNTVALGPFLTQAVAMFLGLNVALFVFNLVPIPPLDGSRVLYAFAPRPLQELLERVEPFGFFIIIGLIVVGGFGSWLAHINQFFINLLV